MILIAGLLLLGRLRPIAKSADFEQSLNASIIIPARNEEKILARLLFSLNTQEYRLYQTIVVDDCSEDKAAEIAQDFGATLFCVRQKPEHWLGKTHASVDVFFFLDADFYFKADGNAAVKSEVLEDVALGKLFEKHGIPVRNQNRGNSISFRMYFQGILFLAAG